MPLPTNQAGLRALEPKCASPTSSASKNTVAQLTEQPLARKVGYLNNAVIWGLPNLVRCALEAKISANSRGAYMNRPVLVEAARSGSAPILNLLLDAGADHGLADSHGFTAMNAAAMNGQLDCVQILLAAGADARQANAVGETPLMSALERQHNECARALIPASDLLATNRAGQNACHVCAFFLNEECFELLLPRMIDVDVRTVPGICVSGEEVSPTNMTSLHIACWRGSHQIAKVLLKRGANRMARDSVERTSCHHAAAYGHLSCCILLVGQPGRRKMTPAEVDAGDVNGFTALHLAAEGGLENICGFLIEAGARLDAKKSDGFTPLMHARQFQPTNEALHALLSGHGPANPPGTVCEHCGKTAAQASVSSLKVCGNCRAARFCNAACQTAAWPGHKVACKARVKEREEAAKPEILDSYVASAQAGSMTGPSQS